MAGFKATSWNLMYIGAVLCALISVATIYQITITQNTSDEWIIWICVLLGFGLVGFGYLYESRHKKDHSENEPTLKRDAIKLA